MQANGRSAAGALDPTDPDARSLLRRMFNAAVAAADPNKIVPRHIPERPKGRTVVVGAGKASAAMARALEGCWAGDLEGIVVVPYGHEVQCERIEVVSAAHPVPDRAGERAGRRILKRVSGLSADDLVIALISGGASALLVAGAPGVGLAEKQAVGRALLASGASIREMNCVRKHLSAIKGGGLAVAAWPARVVTLAISDVPGDDPAVIGSGLTVADPTTYAEAQEILERYEIAAPASVRMHLAAAREETPKPGDPRVSRAEVRVIATPQMSLLAAAEIALGDGVIPVVLGDAIEGEAREVARVMAGIAQQVVRYSQPVPSRCVLLSGGETTVTVRGDGRGGRNVEFLLALAVALNGLPKVWALAADTDGVDGCGDAAGAVVTPTTIARAAEFRMRPADYLARNDAHTFFAGLGDQVVTGPTLTNVNDFRALYVQ